jgi:medium-chain acyl-[acyl-carrier-protein] hydrolase
MTNKLSFNSWVTYPQPRPQAKQRLFCFSFAGGRALNFRPWFESFPKMIEICPVEYPGRGSQMGSQPFTELKPLVEAIASALIPHLDKPFAFFGHSMGALVSFELTHLLKSESSLTPSHLFVSACRAPQLPPTRKPIYNLPESELKAELRRFNGTPEAVLENSELMEILLPILRADFAVVDTYVYTHKPPLECPIIVFGGLQDQVVSYAQLAAWQEQAVAPVLLKMFKGDHFFLHSDQTALVQSILQVLGNEEF